MGGGMSAPRDADYYRKWRKRRAEERKANMPEIRCKGCCAGFTPTSAAQEYHSPACRQKAFRNRHDRKSVTALRNTVTAGVEG